MPWRSIILPRKMRRVCLGGVLYYLKEWGKWMPAGAEYFITSKNEANVCRGEELYYLEEWGECIPGRVFYYLKEEGKCVPGRKYCITSKNEKPGRSIILRMRRMYAWAEYYITLRMRQMYARAEYLCNLKEEGKCVPGYCITSKNEANVCRGGVESKRLTDLEPSSPSCTSIWYRDPE